MPQPPDFYPRPPRGGRQPASFPFGAGNGFLSTPSARRATFVEYWRLEDERISIHALREEGDRSAALIGRARHLFLSTPSARRATAQRVSAVRHGRISIHALREEGDVGEVVIELLLLPISIHALREEGDVQLTLNRSVKIKFLSTPSARRATLSQCHSQKLFCDFYPRPPRGGRHTHTSMVFYSYMISIHALREEGDASCIFFEQLLNLFLSTPSARRATFKPISKIRHPIHFYPRPPRGGRRDRLFRCKSTTKFLSTPSARRATAKTETKSLFSNKLYNILHEFRRALIYNGSKNYPNHAK